MSSSAVTVQATPETQGQLYTVTDSKGEKHLFYRHHLINANEINKNGWAVNPDTLDYFVNTFVGTPVLLYYDRILKIFDHTPVVYGSYQENLDFQRPAAIGTIYNIVRDKSVPYPSYLYDAEITDQKAKQFLMSLKTNNIPFHSSPAIFFDPQTETNPQDRKRWMGLHVALVSNPAYKRGSGNIVKPIFCDSHDKNQCALQFDGSINAVAAASIRQEDSQKPFTDFCKEAALTRLLLEQSKGFVNVSSQNYPLVINNTADMSTVSQTNNNNEGQTQTQPQVTRNEQGQVVTKQETPYGSMSTTYPDPKSPVFVPTNNYGVKPVVEDIKIALPQTEAGKKKQEEEEEQQNNKPSQEQQDQQQKQDSEKIELIKQLELLKQEKARAEKERELMNDRIAEIELERRGERISRILPMDLFHDDADRFQGKEFNERIKKYVEKNVPIEILEEVYSDVDKLANKRANKILMEQKVKLVSPVAKASVDLNNQYEYVGQNSAKEPVADQQSSELSANQLREYFSIINKTHKIVI